MLLLLLLSFGCTNRYINKAYVSTHTDIRTLSLYPVTNRNIHIKDSTILDFIMKDFCVSKEKSISLLDSLINRNISSALHLYTDNIIISPCKINADSFSGVVDSTTISENDRRILKQLDINLPDKNTQSSSGCPADLVLYIQNMDLDINHEVKYIDSGTPYSSPHYFVFVAKNITFVMWDYKKNCIVSSGKINARSVTYRINQTISDSAKNVVNGQNNKESFWPFLIRSIGGRIADATPFSKNSVDSILNDEEWRTMKKIQFYHPQRDSGIIAGKLEAIYPQVTKSIDNIDSLLSNRDSVRLRLVISPNGKITQARLLDSIPIDSVTWAKMYKDISVSLCDSIANPDLFTIAVLTIRMVNTNDRVHIDFVTNTEMRTRASIYQTVNKESTGSLRNAYNRKLKAGMKIDGKITVKFAIDNNGKVMFCSIVSSTLNSSNFEKEIVTGIKAWKFDRIYSPGDICEVVYPFIFSRE